MRAGKLDRRISIMRKEIEQLASGEILPATWTPVDASRPASVRPLGGEERFQAPELIALEQVEFQVRWAAHLADVTPADRIIYPAISLSNPEEQVGSTRIYDIVNVGEIDRRRGITLIAARRVDPIEI